MSSIGINDQNTHLRALLGQVVQPVFRDSTGALSDSQVDKARSLDELRSFLINQAKIDSLSFRSPYAKVLSQAKYQPIYQLLYNDQTDPSVNYESLIHQLEADLVAVDADAFVAHHIRSEEGREYLTGILDPNFARSYALGHNINSWRANYAKAFARAGMGLVDQKEIEEVTRALNLWNLGNWGVTGEEVSEATLQARDILNQARSRYDHQDDQLKKYQQKGTEVLASWGATDLRHQPGVLGKMQENLLLVWCMADDQTIWPPQDNTITRLREFLKNEIKSLLKNDLPHIGGSNIKLEAFNLKVQKILHKNLYGSQTFGVNNTDTSCRNFIRLIVNKAFREPFDQLVQFSDELKYAFEMGEKVITGAYQIPSPLMGEVSPKGAPLGEEGDLHHLIAGMEGVKRSLWYGYKQHKALSRGMSQAGYALGLSNDIDDIGQANKEIDQWITTLKAASASSVPEAIIVTLQVIEEQIFRSGQKGGTLDRAFKAAEMEGTEQLLGLVQTIGMIYLARGALRATGASKVLATVTGQTQAMGLSGQIVYGGIRGFLAGGAIAAGENIVAITTGEVREGEEDWESLFYDSVATGVAMSFMGMFPALGRANQSMLGQMGTRWLGYGGRYLKFLPKWIKLPMGVVGDGLAETFEESTDQILRKALGQLSYFGVSNFDFQSLALSKRDFYELASLSMTGGAFKANLIMESIGYRPPHAKSWIPTDGNRSTRGTPPLGARGGRGELNTRSSSTTSRPMTHDLRSAIHELRSTIGELRIASEPEILENLNRERVYEAMERARDDGVEYEIPTRGPLTLEPEKGETTLHVDDQGEGVSQVDYRTQPNFWSHDVGGHVHIITDPSARTQALGAVPSSQDLTGAFARSRTQPGQEVTHLIPVVYRSSVYQRGIPTNPVMLRFGVRYVSTSNGTGYFEITRVAITGAAAAFIPEIKARLLKEARAAIENLNNQISADEALQLAAASDTDTSTDAGDGSQTYAFQEAYVLKVVPMLGRFRDQAGFKINPPQFKGVIPLLAKPIITNHLLEKDLNQRIDAVAELLEQHFDFSEYTQIEKNLAERMARYLRDYSDGILDATTDAVSYDKAPRYEAFDAYLGIGHNGKPAFSDLGRVNQGRTGERLVALRFMAAKGELMRSHLDWQGHLRRVGIPSPSTGEVSPKGAPLGGEGEAQIAEINRVLDQMAAIRDRFTEVPRWSDANIDAYFDDIPSNPIEFITLTQTYPQLRTQAAERLRVRANEIFASNPAATDFLYLATYDLNTYPATTVSADKGKYVIIADKGEMGVRAVNETVAKGRIPVVLYNEKDDSNAWQVRLAKENRGIVIGLEGNFKESYANPEQIAQKVRETFKSQFGDSWQTELAQAGLYPGYGPLAENSIAIRHFREMGMTFVGPMEDVVDAVGDKRNFRQIAELLDSSAVTPGVVIDSDDPQEIKIQILQAYNDGKFIFPGRLKAANGGGGRGQVVVNSPEELDAAISRVLSDIAANGWSPGVMFEQNIPETVHLEVQIARDRYGNTRHFGMRDCTEQRNSQKIQEEAPPAILRKYPGMQEQIEKLAVTIADKVGYVGAGTVEIMFKDGKFYLLEMNTRIQVEHPVTEETHVISQADGQIVPLNLVQLQLDIAEGKAIDFEQEQVKQVAVGRQFRINAEAWNALRKDPRDGKMGLFDPAACKFDKIGIPTSEQVVAALEKRGIVGIKEVQVRFDSGFEPGDGLINKDPTWGKLIVSVVVEKRFEAQAYELHRLASLEVLKQVVIEGKELDPSGNETGNLLRVNVAAHIRILESMQMRRHVAGVDEGRHVNWVVPVFREGEKLDASPYTPLVRVADHGLAVDGAPDVATIPVTYVLHRNTPEYVRVAPPTLLVDPMALQYQGVLADFIRSRETQFGGLSIANLFDHQIDPRHVDQYRVLVTVDATNHPLSLVLIRDKTPVAALVSLEVMNERRIVLFNLQEGEGKTRDKKKVRIIVLNPPERGKTNWGMRGAPEAVLNKIAEKGVEEATLTVGDQNFTIGLGANGNQDRSLEIDNGIGDHLLFVDPRAARGYVEHFLSYVRTLGRRDLSEADRKANRAFLQDHFIDMAVAFEEGSQEYDRLIAGLKTSPYALTRELMPLMGFTHSCLEVQEKVRHLAARALYERYYNSPYQKVTDYKRVRIPPPRRGPQISFDVHLGTFDDNKDAFKHMPQEAQTGRHVAIVMAEVPPAQRSKAQVVEKQIGRALRAAIKANGEWGPYDVMEIMASQHLLDDNAYSARLCDIVNKVLEGTKIRRVTIWVTDKPGDTNFQPGDGFYTFRLTGEGGKYEESTAYHPDFPLVPRHEHPMVSQRMERWRWQNFTSRNLPTTRSHVHATRVEARTILDSIPHVMDAATPEALSPDRIQPDLLTRYITHVAKGNRGEANQVLAAAFPNDFSFLADYAKHLENLFIWKLWRDGKVNGLDVNLAELYAVKAPKDKVIDDEVIKEVVKSLIDTRCVMDAFIPEPLSPQRIQADFLTSYITEVAKGNRDGANQVLSDAFPDREAVTDDDYARRLENLFIWKLFRDGKIWSLDVDLAELYAGKILTDEVIAKVATSLQGAPFVSGRLEGVLLDMVAELGDVFKKDLEKDPKKDLEKDPKKDLTLYRNRLQIFLDSPFDMDQHVFEEFIGFLGFHHRDLLDPLRLRKVSVHYRKPNGEGSEFLVTKIQGDRERPSYLKTIQAAPTQVNVVSAQTIAQDKVREALRAEGDLTVVEKVRALVGEGGAIRALVPDDNGILQPVALDKVPPTYRPSVRGFYCVTPGGISLVVIAPDKTANKRKAGAFDKPDGKLAADIIRRAYSLRDRVTGRLPVLVTLSSASGGAELSGDTPTWSGGDPLDVDGFATLFGEHYRWDGIDITALNDAVYGGGIYDPMASEIVVAAAILVSAGLTGGLAGGAAQGARIVVVTDPKTGKPRINKKGKMELDIEWGEDKRFRETIDGSVFVHGANGVFTNVVTAKKIIDLYNAGKNADEIMAKLTPNEKRRLRQATIREAAYLAHMMADKVGHLLSLQKNWTEDDLKKPQERMGEFIWATWLVEQIKLGSKFGTVALEDAAFLETIRTGMEKLGLGEAYTAWAKKPEKKFIGSEDIGLSPSLYQKFPGGQVPLPSLKTALVDMAVKDKYGRPIIRFWNQTYAPELCCGFMALPCKNADGMVEVRMHAFMFNDPTDNSNLAGAVAFDSARKAEAFIKLCDKYGLRRLNGAGTPGFNSTKLQEKQGIIDAGGRALGAECKATNPTVSLVFGVSTGGADIFMAARDLRAGRVRVVVGPTGYIAPLPGIATPVIKDRSGELEKAARKDIAAIKRGVDGLNTAVSEAGRFAGKTDFQTLVTSLVDAQKRDNLETILKLVKSVQQAVTDKFPDAVRGAAFELIQASQFPTLLKTHWTQAKAHAAKGTPEKAQASGHVDFMIDNPTDLLEALSDAFLQAEQEAHDYQISQARLNALGVAYHMEGTWPNPQFKLPNGQLCSAAELAGLIDAFELYRRIADAVVEGVIGPDQPINFAGQVHVNYAALVAVHRGAFAAQGFPIHLVEENVGVPQGGAILTTSPSGEG